MREAQLLRSRVIGALGLIGLAMACGGATEDDPERGTRGDGATGGYGGTTGFLCEDMCVPCERVGGCSLEFGLPDRCSSGIAGGPLGSIYQFVSVQPNQCCYRACWSTGTAGTGGTSGYGSVGGVGGGRPYLVDGQARTASTVFRDDWASPVAPDLGALGLEIRRGLCDGWLADARLEHASVAAFARLTLELLAMGAPPELIEESQRASLDEIAHARDCFALASAYAGTPIGPGALPLEGVLSKCSLVELAVRTVHEGCVGETIAALVASAALRGATDHAVRSALVRIARDESRHAELSWRVVAWALRAGGPEVARAVASAFEQAVATPPRIDAGEIGVGDAAGFRAHGRLNGAELADVLKEAMAEVVAPCAAALLEMVTSPGRDVHDPPQPALHDPALPGTGLRAVGA